ncbi:tetratricopeptide repeat protein [Terricaulis silvestris]|uniref:Cytochrome c biogenesis factor n=1 Tax=Terricaulis silvestris TaxID=2686094 RepID=A0A6I6MK32_9CAUL|nr:tetratricopeptide repeat protein [Terricaulis silvestris]QGZ95580.1 Cytochrome c biogenesis factor [Terricaulis silvestris]
MWSSLAVLLVGAVITAAAAFWVLRAYRRAGGGVRSRMPALMLCAIVSVAALGVYITIGRPELADAPYAERLEALKQRDPSTFTADETLAILRETARANPRDPLPLFYSGQLLLGQSRYREAAAAFDSALRRDPRLAEAMLGLGRALVRIEDGRVTPEALALFQQAGALTNDPAPWIYQAMAAMEENREADARAFWSEAYTRMAPDDPRRDMARQMGAGARRGG